jgi:adenosylcobyric acid synthase
MARTLLVAGTASHVGKSTVAAGLCRLLASRGVDVAPFKAQNMSNNARAVPRATGEGFGEVGVSQYVQARAAGVQPTTDHNPVLLKPRGDGESQVVVDGAAVTHAPAGDYYDDHWAEARAVAAAAHDRLAASHDVVVAEGAGSIAEINLHDRDLANVETARFADADVLLVADVERGGVFAAMVGTLELLPDDVRERVVGCVVTKFRGDRGLLAPGLDEFEARTGVPVLGVLPYDDPGLPAEDSLSLPDTGERGVLGDDPGADATTVVAPRLPHASNVADLDPLAATPGVRVAVRPIDADLDDADAVVLTGTKNTVDDCRAARAADLGDRLRGFDGPVAGLCGGYQLLGERLTGASAEGVGDRDEVPALGVLPVETAFSPEKRVRQSTLHLDGGDEGPLAGVDATVSGYEIHAGETRATDDVATPFADGEGDRAGADLGAARGEVVGTYLHGLFEHDGVRAALLRAAGWEGAAGDVDGEGRADDADPYDAAARLVGEHVDLAALFPEREVSTVGPDGAPLGDDVDHQ